MIDRKSGHEYCSSGSRRLKSPTLRSGRLYPARDGVANASRSPSSTTARSGRPVCLACRFARASNSSWMSIVVFMLPYEPYVSIWATHDKVLGRGFSKSFPVALMLSLSDHGRVLRQAQDERNAPQRATLTRPCPGRLDLSVCYTAGKLPPSRKDGLLHVQ